MLPSIGIHEVTTSKNPAIALVRIHQVLFFTLIPVSTIIILLVYLRADSDTQELSNVLRILKTVLELYGVLKEQYWSFKFASWGWCLYPGLTVCATRHV